MQEDVDFKDTVEFNLDFLIKLEIIDINVYLKEIIKITSEQKINKKLKKIKGRIKYLISENLLLLALEFY